MDDDPGGSPMTKRKPPYVDSMTSNLHVDVPTVKRQLVSVGPGGFVHLTMEPQNSLMLVNQ